MKRYISQVSRRLTLALLCLLFLGAAKAQTIPNIQFPDLYPGQQIKGLVIIHKNVKKSGRDEVLTSLRFGTSSNPVFTDFAYWRDRLFSPPSLEYMLWFLVQDYNRNAFALVSAADKYWLGFVNATATTPKLYPVPQLDQEGNEANPDVAHYLNFLVPNYNKLYNLGPAATDSAWVDWSIADRKLYAFSIASKPDHYLKTDPVTHKWCYNCNLPDYTGSRQEVTFRLEPYVYPGGISPFQAIPFQASAYHNKDIVTLAGGEKLTRLSRNAQDGNKAKDVVLSCHAFVGELKNDTLLKVDLSGADNACIGWLSYEKVTYSQNAVQNYMGDRAALPRFGIGVANNKVYAIKEGFADTLSTATTFRKSHPLIVAIEAGKMKVSQTINGISSSVVFYDVPVHSILSEGLGSKAGLVARLRPGDTLLAGYKPGNWLFSNSTAGTQAPFITSTNPDLPMSTDPGGLVNNFDWRTRTYRLRYKSNGMAISETVNSPFFSDHTELKGISAQYNAAGKHAGGEDNNPYSGWELIKADLGYRNDGSEVEANNLRAEPYMILYNRYRGKLRVFVYLNNNSIANNYKITLLAANAGIHGEEGEGTNAQYKPPFLWSSYLQGKPLDDASLTAPDYYKAQQLNSTSSGRFYYTDFQMNYDPCVAFFESAIQVKVDKLSQGTMSIVGRSLGGSIPGSAAINDWMAKNGNFLAGALNSSYGSLSQTMGDLTFNNYRQWGVDSMKNYARFTLPGKKVATWEKEEARLKWQSELTKASGTFIVATGTTISAIGEAAGVQPLKGLIGDHSAVIKATGKFVEASGKFIEAGGTLTSAHANQLRYENLKDAPDVNIPVKMPDPQPSLVYSDLALQGTLSIQSPVFSNVFFTTPGSKNAKYAPEFRPGSGAKGDFPLYNETLGLYNLLTTPVAGLAVSGRTAQVALKEYPVVAVNGRIAGANLMMPAVQLAVTTYDTGGVARSSGATRSYVLTNNESALDSYDRLPAVSDVSGLVEWETLDSNILKSGGNLTDEQYAAKLSQWVRVQLVVSFNLFAGKSPDGNYEGSATTMTFPALTSIKASRAGAIPAETLAGQFGYGRVNAAFFGTHHVVNGSDTALVIRQLMNTFCHAHQAGQISALAHTSAKPAAPGSDDDAPAPEKMNGTSSIEGMRLYPNPTRDECRIAYAARSKGNILIELFDINGRCLLQHRDAAAADGERKAAAVYLGALPPGIYAVKVRFSNNSYYTGKIVKR
ncbi:T9SS type A sorting domain-containing protein [Taibaiella koreensis]|uniref:T9SS type A sorting domain-containing protein n=1 Tax=Taibaiella koreensis TaxID=1268548 RepID=UPI000E5A0342|nr:T9SS type A sorting domain-containing protein [Taibaiella koreensis]